MQQRKKNGLHAISGARNGLCLPALCVSKANQMLCWISRNIISREKSIMLRVYKTLIRPHLEYCVQLWNPAAEHGNWSLILRIESVQRRFTRMIEEVGLLPYSERLRILQLTTLAERRSRGDLIEVYKANKSSRYLWVWKLLGNIR